MLGGTLGATIIGMPFAQIKTLPRIMRQAFFQKPIDALQVVKTVVGYAVRARRDGVLALEEEAKNVDSDFLRLGLQLVVDGTPSDMTREILETEVEAMNTRHRRGEAIFSAMGGFAPTLGIIGTVMGLVHMLANLSEPGQMGGAIANAFIATLYGVMTANLLFLPIASKLKLRSQQEVVAYQVAIEGILAIQAGESPRQVSRACAPSSPRSRRLPWKRWAISMSSHRRRRALGDHDGEGGGHDGGGMMRWLLTYADMITLLTAFFIMMYSMSVINLQRFRQVAIAIRSGFNGEQTGAGLFDKGGVVYIEQDKKVPTPGPRVGPHHEAVAGLHPASRPEEPGHVPAGRARAGDLPLLGRLAL